MWRARRSNARRDQARSAHAARLYDVDDIDSLRCSIRNCATAGRFATGLLRTTPINSNHLMRSLLSGSDLMRRLAADAGALVQ